MPPKGKDKAGGKGKQGSQLKDILPPNAKQPREGEPVEVMEEPTEEQLKNQEKNYQYLPYPDYPVWPGNQEVQALFEEEKTKLTEEVTKQQEADGAASQNEDNLDIPEDKLFKDEHWFYLPTSFHEFEKKKIKWKRPNQYLYEIMHENDAKKNKSDKKNVRKRKTSKRFRLGSSSNIGSSTNVAVAEGSKKKINVLKRPKVNYKVIGYQERPEAEDEMRRRKEEEEKVAGKEKKKPPKKGEEEEQPQMMSVAIETNLDMGFLMPAYSKWITSQLQFIKDRTVRDTVTKEPIWKRIFPQENGIPVKSITGKYRVKLRFLGEERIVEIDDRMP